MKVNKLNEMFRGWVVGNFDPSLHKTDEFEVAVKTYKKGDYEPKHYHKVATEITIISKGRVVMNNEVYNEGDIITIEPNEATDFRATNDVITTVIKFPCLTNDKYLVE
jgi:quercetin dioxygenase-like cupin family protein